MKRIISFCLLLCILATAIVIAPVTASADASVKLSSKIKFKNGESTISWSDSGDSGTKYQVTYQVTKNGPATQAEFIIGETRNKKIQTMSLIPGKSYTIRVYDYDTGYLLASKTYKMPNADDFQDGKMKQSSIKHELTVVYTSYGTSSPKKVNSIKGTTMAKNLKKKKYDYGIKYVMKMPQQSKDRKYITQIAIESSEGFLQTIFASEEVYKRAAGAIGRYWYWEGRYSWSFGKNGMMGQYFFRNMYKLNDDVPTGKYKVYIYLNGMYLKTLTFKVK